MLHLLYPLLVSPLLLKFMLPVHCCQWLISVRVGEKVKYNRVMCHAPVPRRKVVICIYVVLRDEGSNKCTQTFLTHYRRLLYGQNECFHIPSCEPYSVIHLLNCKLVSYFMR